jgi:Ca-activated chloride channel family protein
MVSQGMDGSVGIKKWSNGVMEHTNYELRITNYKYRSNRDLVIRYSLFVFISLMLMLVFPVHAQSKDFEFMNLWMTPDQQGRYYFENGNYDEAAKRFKDPLWKGFSYYSIENFETAIGEFAKVNTPEGYFNLGNAYAHNKNYEEAVKSYDTALKLSPDYHEARINSDIVYALIEKKKKEEDEQEQQGDPSLEADEIKFDEKGKKGKKGEIEQSMFTEEQIAEMWMRNIRTSPADFLRMKFASQTENGKTEK